MYIWLANGYIYYGLLYVLPQTLKDETSDSSLWEIAITVIVEFPTNFVGLLLMEWIGRIKGMWISFICLSLALVPCSFFPVNDFFVV